jgi:chromosome segregation ATPase
MKFNSHEELKSWINKLEDVTSRCMQALEKENYAHLNQLLETRNQIQQKILESFQKKSLINILNDKELHEVKRQMEKISKDLQLLVDNINEKRKGVVKELKQLQAGKKSLSQLREKVKAKRVISRLI